MTRFFQYSDNANIKVSAMLTLFDRKGDLSFMNEIDKGFDQVAAIIENARANAFRKVNEGLILMYWNVGRLLSEKA